MKRIVCFLGAMFLTSNELRAQYFEYEINNFFATTSKVTGEFRFRNTQTAVTDGKVYVIRRVGLSLPDAQIGPGDVMTGAGEPFGNIFLGQLDVGNGLLPFFNFWSPSGAVVGPGQHWGDWMINDNSITNGLGLVGCVVPTGIDLEIVPHHAGVTCIGAGFDGWMSIQFGLDLHPDNEIIHAKDELVVEHYFAALETGYYFLTPEPSTYAFMVVGFGVLALLRVRRRMQ